MGLRLYQITDTTTRKPVPNMFFHDKPSAKAKRIELNDSNPEVFKYIVSPGPDHKNYPK